MLGAAQELEVLEGAVRIVAVLPPDSVTLGDRPVRRFPDHFVNEHPVGAAAAFAGRFGIVADFHPQIAVPGRRDDRSHRQPGMRPLPFLELRFPHAASKPTRPAQAFVVRNMAFLESERHAGGEDLAWLHPAMLGDRKSTRLNSSH